MNEHPTTLKKEAVDLLKQLISLPSFSREEDKTASLLSLYLAEKGLASSRVGNNVFAKNKYFDEGKPTILLCSHHDTVRPNAGYTNDPFCAITEDDRLFGLGSNDAGASLVALTATFLHFHEKENLRYNLFLALVAEEEISGEGGISSLFPFLPKIDCALIGEPTQMQLAVAERGLLVLDCTAKGAAGHAAREEGENAIYKALMDIEWIHCFQFPKVSPFLGPVKMSVTVIETDNKAHNMVPDTCRFVVDIRINELYTHEEVLEIIEANLQSKIEPRGMRLRSTVIEAAHPLVKAGLALGREMYGSPTSSDKALLPFPALKMGPGDSARSHTANEYIYISEIEQGIDLYTQLLNQLL